MCKDAELRAREAELRAKDEELEKATRDAAQRILEGKERLKRLTEEFAEKWQKAREELEISRPDTDVVDGVDLNASTEVVPATEAFVSLKFPEIIPGLISHVNLI